MVICLNTLGGMINNEDYFQKMRFKESCLSSLFAQRNLSCTIFTINIRTIKPLTTLSLKLLQTVLKIFYYLLVCLKCLANIVIYFTLVTFVFIIVFHTKRRPKKTGTTVVLVFYGFFLFLFF